MSSPNLNLPFILAAQAQKHVTHNEAVRLLDALVQLSVIDATLTAPPGSPAAGDRHIVAATATGAWTGWENSVAYYADGAWYRLVPNAGWQVFNEATGYVLTWGGSSWDRKLASLNTHGKVPRAQVPGYTDDVLEFANLAAFPNPGTGGKIYIALDTGLTYTWPGSLPYAISGAVPDSTDTIAEGTINLYFTPARVLSAILAGLSLATSTAVTAADTVLQAIGKLQAQVTLRAPLASPPLTGTPTAPTAAPGTNTTQLATTAFAAAGLALKADLASPPLTGTPTAPTAAPGTNTTQLATTAFAAAAAAAIVGALDVVVFKGVTDCSANPNYPAADAGAWYVVSVAGKIGGASGVTVEAGDAFLCLVDSTASGNQATVGANWAVMNKNLDRVVIGPAGTVTDLAIAIFDGTSGLLLKQISDAAFKTRLALTGADVAIAGLPFELVVACGDETTDMTTGTKVTMRMPRGVTLSSVKASLATAATGATLFEIDVKEAGTTIFSTRPKFDASATTTVGGATPGVISDASLAADAIMTFIAQAIGNTTAGKGLKITLVGVYA